MINTIEQNGGATKARGAANENDFKNLVDLLAIYTEAGNQLKEIEAEANHEMLELIDSKKKEYAAAQAKMMEAGEALDFLTIKHPEWFKERKTLKTPYGEVSRKENPPKIVCDNPEVSVVLLEAEGKSNKDFDSETYLRRVTELNLETLAGMTDEQLKKFRLRRERTETFSVKPAKLDMGKAVKEAAAKESK